MHTRLLCSIGFLSVAIIAFQLVLMQILSIVQWYHFAYMIISVALLGFGASGTFITLFKEKLLKHFEVIVPLTMFLCAAAIALVVWISQTLLGGFDSYLLFIDRSHVYLLLGTYILFFVPFFFGAVAIGLVFIKYVQQIGFLYFANLVGSGVGGVVAIILFWFVFPNQLPALIAVIPLIAGVVITPWKAFKILSPVIAVALVVIGLIYIFPPDLSPSEYKSLSRTLLLPDAKIVKEKNSPQGFVKVVSSPVLRFAPGISLSYREEVPVYDVVFNNGEWFGPVSEWSRHDTTHILDYTTFALPYEIRKRENVLILNAGTGTPVAHAMIRDAKRVVAVEPHSTITSIIVDEYASVNDSLFHNPRVHLKTIEPRTYLITDTTTYDVIILPTVETFGGTAGVYALQEQYILTKEAFIQMWSRLSDDGVISITSWMDYPVRNPLKILATFVEVLEELGIREASQHIIAVRSWGTITFVLKRNPFTSNEIQRIRDFSNIMLFDPALLPDLRPDERARYNQIQDDDFFRYLDEIITSDREALYTDYDFYLRPATDNRPYFSQFIRWQSIPYLTELFGQQAVPFLEVGYLIVAVTFIQITFAAIVLIVVPLFKLGWYRENDKKNRPSNGKMWTVLYFSGLGLGFMFIEIVLIQKFILYLGQPIYSAAAVISALLICSGIGSYFSTRLSPYNKNLRRILSVVIGLIVLYILILDPIFLSTLTFPLVMKAFLTLLIIAPLGFVMGMPFPVGLRVLSQRNEHHLPWAWGINGCMSVVSTALAMIIAVELGFVWVMIFAACAYGVAMGVNVRK